MITLISKSTILVKSDMIEDLVTVGLGRRVVKASSSMLPRSVPPLGKTMNIMVYSCGDDVGDGGGNGGDGGDGGGQM